MPMKELLKQYAAYNLWANSKMLDAIYLLSHEQHHKEIESSFNSLYKTVFHVLGAETVWFSRLQQGAHIAKMDDTFNGQMQELGSAWNQMDRQWLNFMNNITDDFLNKKLDYQNMKGDPFSQEVYLIVLQVFNHSTYHRGQMVTILRQVGSEKIPNSDFISWSRIGK